MWKDPIVEEIRAIRRQLSEEAGNDLHEICRRLREWEEKNPDRVIAPPASPKKSHRRKPAIVEIK
jgi:hypothetical protein